MRFCHVAILMVATICSLVADAGAQVRTQGTSQLDQSDSRTSKYDEQSTRQGWVPEGAGTQFGRQEDAPLGTFPPEGTERAKQRERLRQAYTGVIVTQNPYDRLLSPETDSSLQTGVAVDCDCSPNCNCPPHVCDAKHCLKNYAVMISMSWCAPCKKMYPLIKELRKEGYFVYVYVCDEFEEYRDLDAKYDVKGYPTFVVFDKGKEVTRHLGKVDKQWFYDHLVPGDDQSEPENPYDGL